MNEYKRGKRAYWFALWGFYETAFIVTNFERIMSMKRYIEYCNETQASFYTPMAIKARLKKKKK